MLSWLFGKNRNELNQINSRLDNSFNKIREDMNHVSRWINHFKSKHDDSEKMFRLLSKRLNRIESYLESLSPEAEEVAEVDEEFEEPKAEMTSWDSLTETLQRICIQLAAIQKELPNQWVSLKYLAQELYPDKQYNQVRSTLSQYISSLEDMGYVKRVRKGKQAYVYSTKKNPCLKKKKKLLQKVKAE